MSIVHRVIFSAIVSLCSLYAYFIFRSVFFLSLFLNIFTVHSPPRIIKQPPTDELLYQVAQQSNENDKPFLIECEAEGEPAPKYVYLFQIQCFFVVLFMYYRSWNERVWRMVFICLDHISMRFSTKYAWNWFQLLSGKIENPFFQWKWIVYDSFHAVSVSQTKQSYNLVLCPIFKPKVAYHSQPSQFDCFELRAACTA